VKAKLNVKFEKPTYIIPIFISVNCEPNAAHGRWQIADGKMQMII